MLAFHCENQPLKFIKAIPNCSQSNHKHSKVSPSIKWNPSRQSQIAFSHKFYNEMQFFMLKNYFFTNECLLSEEKKCFVVFLCVALLTFHDHKLQIWRKQLTPHHLQFLAITATSLAHVKHIRSMHACMHTHSMPLGAAVSFWTTLSKPLGAAISSQTTLPSS